MARKRKRKATRKATRSRARRRRRNPRNRSYAYMSGSRKRRRSRRKSARTYRRRRNPARFKRMARQYFSKDRLTNAVMLLVGIGGSGALKGFTANFMPTGAMKDWYQRLYGLLSIVVGATLNMRGRRKEMKSIGTGMVVFGLYDIIVSNVQGLQQYLPSIAAPTAFVSGGYQDYGRSTYENMGASVSPGGVEVVGANIQAGEMPEIVGMEDYDLADHLDMAA